VVVAFLGVACCGCGPRPTGTPTSQVGRQEEQILQRTPTVELGAYLPPLDDGRVEIAPPDGWGVLPRDSAYLTRFFKENRSGLPRIDVRVEADRYGDLGTATDQSVEEFAQQVAAELEAEGTKPLEPVLPMLLGDVPCARYVVATKLRMGDRVIAAERQRLLVLRDGRLYTVDLLVLAQTLKKDRDAAYAVVAGLRFPDPGAAGAELPDEATEGEASEAPAIDPDDTVQPPAAE
jgi:hypothetical protein